MKLPRLLRTLLWIVLILIGAAIGLYMAAWHYI